MQQDAPVMLLVTKHALNIFGLLTVLAGAVAVVIGPKHPLETLLAGLGMLLAGSLLHLATVLTLASEAYLRQKTAALDRGAAND
ncbi:MAG TPA: hypothetical protein PLI98_03865 [Candidatus Hydrogenedentes bacterium]|nr:hypothetical protein [Candidatus Hydrogenedentota bacterium]